MKEEFEDTKGGIRIEEQTMQRPKEKVQKDKQRSAKHTYKTKDRVTRTPLKSEVNSGPVEWEAHNEYNATQATIITSNDLRQGWIPLTVLTQPYVCTCAKPGHRFPTLYLVVFFVFRKLR